MARSYASARTEHVGTKGSFTLDGVQFDHDGFISTLELSDMAGAADLDVATPEGMAVLARFFRALLGSATYVRFRNHVRDHRTDDDTILAIMQDAIEDVLGRPTEAPSPLPVTSSPTGTSSRAPSSPPVTVEPPEGEVPVMSLAEWGQRNTA